MKKLEFEPIILRNLNKPWESIADKGQELTLAPRHAVACSDVGGVYYIRSGLMRLSLRDLRGHEKILFYLGEHTLFNENPVSTSWCEARFTCMEETNAIFFTKEFVRTEAFVREYPALVFNWHQSALVKVKSIAMQLYHAGFTDAFTLLCRALVSMAQHNVMQGVIVPFLSKQELSSLLGIHRSSLHQAIKRLQTEEIIGEFTRKRLDVRDFARLYQYACASSATK